MFGKHFWIFLILTWFLKTDVIWFISVSEEFLNGFRFSFLDVFMKNLFIVLEITLSFVMKASFSTSVILLEFDLLLLKKGFTDLQKLLLSATSQIFILLKYCFFDLWEESRSSFFGFYIYTNFHDFYSYWSYFLILIYL